MSDRPAFQFYPKDWRNNAKLQRCGLAAKGAWTETMCLLHDADEYGVLRWPLEDIAQAAHVPADLLRDLATKGVLKGSDAFSEDYTYRPFHAGKHGAEVVLVKADGGPCWFCSRFVKDEWKRHQRGKASQFSVTNQPPKPEPIPAPMPPIGERQGDGPSSASASALAVEAKAKAMPRGTRLPADWTFTPEREAYCRNKRPDLDPIATHEAFEDWWRAATGKGSVKADWDAAWRTWVRGQRPANGAAAPAAKPGGGRVNLSERK